VQHPNELRAARRVEAGRRLVEEEHVRTGQQLDRDARALPLAAGECTDAHVRALVEIECMERLRHPRLDLACRVGRRQAQARGVAQRPLERQLGVDDVVLRHVAEDPAERVEVRVQVDAAEPDRALLGRPDARQRLEQHRLAGAAAADDRDEPPARQGQRHVVQHALAAPDRLAEADGDHLDAASPLPTALECARHPRPAHAKRRPPSGEGGAPIA
jgi:hypothetical protein